MSIAELFDELSVRKWGGLTRRERFFSKCTETAAGCLEHCGWQDKDGYPMVDANRLSLRASHVALALKGIEVPQGQQVNHHCDNRRCVNTEHLFLGTQLDNVRDMMNKDRHAIGERHTISKLSDDAVRDIRANCTELGQPKLFAEKYNVSVSTIWAARSKQNWKHVDA